MFYFGKLPKVKKCPLPHKSFYVFHIGINCLTFFFIQKIILKVTMM